jgi:microcystin-dependent protein
MSGNTPDRYRREPLDLVDKVKELEKRLASLEQNPTGSGSGGGDTGAIAMFGGTPANVPSGWLVCDGSAVSRISFGRLFGVIGTTWGAGDGAGTFNLPDLVDKVLVGAGNLYALASSVGGTTHSHGGSSDSQGDHGHSAVGGHSHSIGQGTDQTSQVTGPAVFTVSHQSHTHGGSTGSGGGHSHPNTGAHTHGITVDSGSSLPPSRAVTPIIRF